MAMAESAYQIGILCALFTEYQAVLAIFDEPRDRIRSDKNPDIIYNTGWIGSYHAVAACLPPGRTGSAAASWLATRMMDAFPYLEHRFLVGIAGGVPNGDIDIRLGDIIIGTRIVQYDFGKTLPNGKFQRTREPFKAPGIIPSVLNQLKIRGIGQTRQLIGEILSTMRGRLPDLEVQWTYPGEDQDLLFAAEYDHNVELNHPRCGGCDEGKIVYREARSSLLPMFHDGLIASADQVMRDGRSRDLLKSDLTDIRAVEMEAAGLEDYGFCVIRGICDYADSHKHKQWQSYAAATAAACLKALILQIPKIESYPDLSGPGTTGPSCADVS
jgi:nucleoside phosphorylase